MASPRDVCLAEADAPGTLAPPEGVWARRRGARGAEDMQVQPGQDGGAPGPTPGEGVCFEAGTRYLNVHRQS